VLLHALAPEARRQVPHHDLHEPRVPASGLGRNRSVREAEARRRIGRNHSGWFVFRDRIRMPWILYDGTLSSDQRRVLRKSRRPKNRKSHRRTTLQEMIGYLTSYDFLILVLKMVIIFGAVMNVVGLLSWVERKMMARVQMRPGPTRVGPFGLL